MLFTEQVEMRGQRARWNSPDCRHRPPNGFIERVFVDLSLIEIVEFLILKRATAIGWIFSVNHEPAHGRRYDLCMQNAMHKQCIAVCPTFPGINHQKRLVVDAEYRMRP